ncbi:phage tail tape measure protein [Clostridium sporogenes]|uniref:phage tail tape measure protein n=1 Tax=Clostridium sporogenes TaxID=1509 RepID=UPI0013D1B405|nr:phage tail tape measure protein [Clostridium sporogenes]NFP92417.1 phage tail tape measure protein [Clostridium sporogenes]
MELFTLFGKIAVNDKDANKSIDSVTGKAKQSESVMGKAFSNIGKVVAGAFTVGAIATFEKKIVSTYATYDDQMRKVQAVSGATGKQFMELRSKAEELGAKTRFSATEAGEGMEMLARAGWKTGDIMKGIGPVLNFATANAIDLGQAAGIVSDGLSQFGLKAKDTTMFTDVLSATAAAANTDIGLLGETFKYVGPVAGSLGYKLQDVSVAIGLMANKGIKGSQAGTSLRSALTKLANPTGDSAKLMKELGISITDSTGKVKPFNTLMQELRGRFSKLSDAQKAQYASTIFGQEAMSGMLAVVNSSDEEFNKMTKAIAESSGQTQKMADTMDGGLGGALANVQSAWEGLLIKLGEMQDGPLVDGLNGLAKILQGLPNEIQYVSNKIGEFTQFFKNNETAIKAVGIVLGVLGTGILIYSGKLTAATIATKAISAAQTIYIAGLYAAEFATKAFSATIGFITSPIGIVTIAIAAFAAAAYLIYKNWDKIGPWLKNQWEFIKNTASNIWNGITEAISSAVDAVVEWVSSAWNGLVGIVTSIWNAIANAISTVWNFISQIITAALLGIQFIVQTVFTLLVTIIRAPLELIRALIVTVWNYIGGFVMGIVNNIVQIVQTAWTMIVTVTTTIFTAISNVISTIWNAIVGVITTVVNAIRNIISNVWSAIVNVTSTYFNAVRSVASAIWNAIVAVITPIVNNIRNAVTNAWNAIRNTTTNIFNGIRNTASNIWNGIRNTISNVVNGIRNTVSNVWNGIRSTTTNVWNGIRNAMTTPINAARNTIQNVINTIRGFFTNLRLRFPKIEMPKLPKFHMDGKFSLNPPSVPHLSVKWNAEGGILTKPTIFGANNGVLQGGGEAGHEAVLPIKKLSGIMADTMKQLGYDNKKGEDNIDKTPFIIQIENMNVRKESDIRAIAEELEFYRKRNSLAKGDVY